MVGRVRPQTTILRIRFACWKRKATNTHTCCGLLSAFSLQQWLQERALLSHVYVHCLSCYVLKVVTVMITAL